MRRGTMFRLITESTRMLQYGNAGGAALVIGFMLGGLSSIVLLTLFF